MRGERAGVRPLRYGATWALSVDMAAILAQVAFANALMDRLSIAAIATRPGISRAFSAQYLVHLSFALRGVSSGIFIEAVANRLRPPGLLVVRRVHRCSAFALSPRSALWNTLGLLSFSREQPLARPRFGHYRANTGCGAGWL